MKNKRIFVSGGAGVIGTSLVNHLLDMGADVFVGDLKPCPKEWLGKVKYRQGDLNHIQANEILDFDPHLFFHLAATFERSTESLSFFSENFYHNVKLSHHLISCIKESTSLEKVIFASSYLIYDPSLYLFSQSQAPLPLSEESVINPRNLCGAAKLFHERELQLLEEFFGKNISFVSTRIFRVYGRLSNDVISRWIRLALCNEPLLVYSPEGQFDYIFADDVAEGLVRIAQTLFSGVVNLGTGKSRSVNDVLHVLKEHFPALKIKEQASNLPNESSQANIQLLNTLTNWVPPHTLETAIPKIIEFEQKRLHAPAHREKNSGVLVTSISRKVPLLQAVKNAIEKLRAFNCLHGCDQDETCVGQYAVDSFWHCPPLSELTIEKVLNYCQIHAIKAIIPTRNADLEFYARHKNEWIAQGIHVMVSELNTIEMCLNKIHFANVLKRHHLPVISSFSSLEDFSADSYVVKEQKGAGAINIGLNLSKEEALEFAKQLSQPMFQPFIKGNEWSIDLYRSVQGKVMGCVARQRNSVLRGESQVTTTASYPALEKLAESVADVLNIYGHAVLQVMEDQEGRFHIIECNPRFGGASTASLAVGLDSFYWFLLESLDQDINEYPFMRTKKEIRQIRYPSDWIFPW